MAPHSPSYDEARHRMVEQQIARRGIQDERVLQAMRDVPRHRFVPPDLWGTAYQDHPLPIGHGQTISQPYIVAYMTEMLDLTPNDRVLEIGTGSGYQSAILSRLARQVYTIERIPELANHAQEVLKELGYHPLSETPLHTSVRLDAVSVSPLRGEQQGTTAGDYRPLAETGDYRNIQFRVGDGGYGWPEEAPFDAIIVTAAAPETPPPLIAQLADGAHLVIPIGPTGYQDLVRLTRRGAHIHTEQLTPVAFVPLIGEHGWRGREYDDE